MKKYLKIKFILPLLLIVALTTFLLMFFIGALKPANIDYTKDNIEFSLEGFTNILEANPSELNTQKYVADNDEYCMIIDETTTIVTIIKKGEGWSKTNYTAGEVVYKTADIENKNDLLKSNITLNYYDSRNKLNTYDAFNYSINYVNRLNGEKEKHYMLRYNENSVDVLYQIGNFLNIDGILPAYFNREQFEELFIGNIVFGQVAWGKSVITVSDTNEKAHALMYQDTGYTFSEECASYLENEKGVTVKYNEQGYWELSNLKDADGKMKVTLGDGLNSEGSPCEFNPFSAGLNEIQNTVFSNFYEITDEDETKVRLFLCHNENAAQKLMKKNLSANDNIRLYQMLYAVDSNVTDGSGASYFYPKGATYATKPVYYDYNGDGVYTSDEKLIYGGFQKCEVDEDGNKTWIYDENGNPVQDKFTKEMADDQNQQFGVADASVNAAFQIGLRFEMTENGFKCVVINDSIREGEGKNASDAMFAHEFLIGNIQVLPRLATNFDTTSKGQIILPDGSGSIISFNSEKVKQNVAYYADKRIYGSDSTIPLKERGNYSQDLTLPLFGFLEQSNNKGLVAIVDKGAAQTSIVADFHRGSEGSSNYARFTTFLRETERVVVSSNKEYTKISSNIFGEDVCYDYYLLSGEDLTYVDVANVYRQYLINKYQLTEKDTTKTNNVSINFLGAFTKKQIALGFVYDAEKSLTTFAQAGEIVKDLQNNGLNDLNVVYSYWTEDETTPETTTDINVSSVLGGKKELMKLIDLLKEQNIKFYADYNVTNGRGYDLSFGTLKYSSKSISSSYSTAAQFVLSTGLVDAKMKAGNVLSPRFYNALVEKYTTKTAKYGIDGLSLYDLGNDRNADYNKNNTVYSETAIKLQQEALKTASDKLNGNVLLKSPFDYAVPFAAYATNVPTTATLYPIVDYSIPLYQLIISGLIDYSSEFVNYNNDNSINYNLLKAIETGSNLSFMLAYENTNVLLDTHNTEYFNTYYSNWRTNIISMNNELNKTGIYESRLVGHKYITDKVVEVKYENGLTILINYDNDVYQDPTTGLAVASNWYAIMEEGE